MHEEKDGESYFDKLLKKILFGLVVLPIIMFFFPWLVPFGFWEFWTWKGTPTDWLYSGIPMFLWGAGLATIISLIVPDVFKNHETAGDDFVLHSLRGAWAGFWEETTFRWLIFLGNIVSLKFANFLFFGWLQYLLWWLTDWKFGYVRFLHLNFFGPLANWTTLGYLEPYLYHPATWAVGASMLATNAFFRDGHTYQGPIGWVNSWFGGMFLFWIMFKHGLLAAILVHATYNFIVHLVHYLDAVIQRWRYGNDTAPERIRYYR